jgi:hypothetical protein
LTDSGFGGRFSLHYFGKYIPKQGELSSFERRPPNVWLAVEPFGPGRRQLLATLAEAFREIDWEKQHVPFQPGGETGQAPKHRTHIGARQRLRLRTRSDQLERERLRDGVTRVGGAELAPHV